MGTHITTVFGPINPSPAQIAEHLVNFFTSELSGYLKRYFARLRYASDQSGFEFYDETMELRGKGDLLERIQSEQAGLFACELDLGFAPSVADVAVFSGPRINDGTTVVLTFEKELTSYLFTSEVTAAPFALVLERIARVIGADCFVAGAEYDRWLPLPPAMLTEPAVFGESPQVVGWRHGVVDAALVLKALGAQTAWLKKTLNGFDIVSLLGRADQREKPTRHQ